MTKTQEVTEEVTYNLETARRRCIEYLRDIAKSVTYEIRSLEKSPEVMLATSSAGDLMCLSGVRQARNAANEVAKLSEQIRMLKYLTE